MSAPRLSGITVPAASKSVTTAFVQVPGPGVAERAARLVAGLAGWWPTPRRGPPGAALVRVACRNSDMRTDADCPSGNRPSRARVCAYERVVLDGRSASVRMEAGTLALLPPAAYGITLVRDLDAHMPPGAQISPPITRAAPLF